MSNQDTIKALTKTQLADTMQVSPRTIDRKLSEMGRNEGYVFSDWYAFRIGKRWRFEKRIVAADALAA